MARPSTTRTSRARPGGHGGTLIGVLIGLVLGVLIALAVAWYVSKAPLPFLKQNGRPGVDKADARAHGEPDGDKQGAALGPAPLPGKPGDKPLERPRFDFYKILPGGEEGAPAPKAEEEEKAPAETFFLQAGSFQKPDEADNLKAKLALLGLEASVQPVNIPEKGTLHRVRIGPFNKPDDMAKARSLLAENGIQAKVVKTKEGAPN